MTARSTAATLAVGVALGIGAWALTAACTPDATPETPAPTVTAPTVPATPAFPDRTLTPCAQEDSDDCYWDAAHMGNGTGTSFITLDGVTYYPR